ncbi:uncharacterized protein LOC123556730 [Mercenaria mercenaria]|uniref:uncharacterized protein LOC123556730 n=1 Tax=Mercenaria mercenaria TaxID=6596 RepID=UPI00234F92DE|nr:uncharacterized protein LOC123556730 [Mercenaria mercenaria]XP_045203601.2 uncharacterized protein LOC123556730 [Mercenaria mercenaria]
MAYSLGRGRGVDSRFGTLVPRKAWGDTYVAHRSSSQFRSGTTDTTTVPENSLLGRKGFENEQEQEHQTMDTDDSASKDTSMFRKTIELIATIEGLKPLVEQSKDELKAADESKLKSSVDIQNQRFKSDGNEYLRDENRKLKSDINELKGENAELNNSIKRKEKELQKSLENIQKNVNEQVGKVADEKKNLSEEIRKLRAENERYEKEVEKLKHYCKQEFDKRNELEQSVKLSKADLATMAQECEKLKLQLSQSHKKYETTEKEKTKLEEELSESKTRLSRLMGKKLADNNPDIADLSDKNRPTKLAERYAELYDNEWTDAFEVFNEYFEKEQKSIEMLLVVLKHIKDHCDKMALDQADKLKAAIVVRTDKDCPEYVNKQLKDLRRMTAEVTMPEIYQSYTKEVKNLRSNKMAQLLSDEQVRPFVKGCVELCWLMTVQDPPIVFGPEPQAGDVFDTSVYKHYTKTGASIEFLVWPTLHLHEGGAMLSKGVAQGYGRAQSAPGRPSSRDRRGKNTAASIKESAESRPQTAPLAQNTDRDDKGRIDQTSASANPGSKHLQSQYDQNYQQHVVTGKNTSSNSRLGSTVRDTTGKHTDVNLHSNLSSSVRYASNVHTSRLPPYPGKDAMGRFYQLLYSVGAESQTTKDQLGNKYYDCLNYYNFFHTFDMADL